jgi:hypothetical protein
VRDAVQSRTADARRTRRALRINLALADVMLMVRTTRALDELLATNG